MLLDVARAALDEREYLYELIPDDTLLRFRVQGRPATYACVVRTDEEWRQAIVMVSSTVLIPDPVRIRVAELFARANFGLRIGCFELDLDDGEWHYRVSVDVEGGELTSRMVDLMLNAALQAMDDHHDAVMRVAYGDVSPAEAIADVREAQRARALAMHQAQTGDAAYETPELPDDEV